MKRILFDVNVVLDVLLDRKPHAVASAAAWAAVETGMAEGPPAAHAVTTIRYLVRKDTGARRQLPCPDFEDAVTAAAARLARCDYIVTRDPKGFRGSPVRPLTPEAAIPLFSLE